MKRIYLFVILITSSMVALAELGAHRAPAKSSPTPIYQSGFHDYRSFKNEKLQAWREVNDQVEKLGGHMGHYHGMKSREQQEPKQGEKK